MSRPDPPAILVVNAGSSSVKFALFGVAEHGLGERILEGEVAGIGASATLEIEGARRERRPVALDSPQGPQSAALDVVLEALHDVAQDYTVAAVGHRVVHGGTHFAEPVVVTPAVMSVLEGLSALAPLHQPHNLAALRRLQSRLPDALQVACFDTAFHRTCSPLAQRFALPRALHDAGIRRYGFHGLSYEYIARQLPALLPPDARRVIVAHLGAGASLAALMDGKSIATTMGFTALDGLMMGTRCGNLDPGVVLHLLTAQGMSVEDVTRLLYRESGLLGVSGLSADMRELLSSETSAAQEAVSLFCYRAVREIGSLTAALGGLDAVVFTAGIGERAAPIRQRIIEGLGWLGATLNPEANAKNATRISTPDSALSAWVIPTDEEAMIAVHTRALMAYP